MRVFSSAIKSETTVFLIKNICGDIKPPFQPVFRTYLEYISFLDAHQSYLCCSDPPPEILIPRIGKQSLRIFS